MSKKDKTCKFLYLQVCNKVFPSSNLCCRCGGVYCSIHRYAETHSCTFNYKAEGKELIARNNPLVTAPKLSKF